MAGHSKWANIQHRKAAQDAKRGKIFTKLIREIVVSARVGGEDPGSNPRLRAAIDKALGSNMKRDTINNAIKRGAGGLEGANYAEITYEGYGVNGVAFMVACLTDNKNRTVAEVRHAFSKWGGNLGTDGSVAYLFSKEGQCHFEPGQDENKLMELVLDLDIKDFIVDEDGRIEIITAPEHFSDLLAALEKADLRPDFAEVTFQASTEVAVQGEQAEKILKLIDMLEDLDDVQDVYHNAEIAEDAYAN